MQELTIIQPDDWHIHLRDGAVLADTVRDASRYFGRAIVMPNLTPPVVNTEQAAAYKERILAALPEGRNWSPLMVLYLTDNTSTEDILAASASGFIYGAKLYPAGATTNSDSGVTDPAALGHVYAAMEDAGLPLLVHGEVTDADIDIFDREAEFIERTLAPIVAHYPRLKVVFEHITTAQAVEFVEQAPANVAATITAQHLLYNRNDMLVGGIRPHLYCLPILKKNIHQQALLAAATSGKPKFFLGTDSAPHSVGKKETDCGCAGCYTAHAALELYAEVFEQLNSLDQLEAFASLNGPAFYGLEPNKRKVRLVKSDMHVPARLQLGDTELSPIRAGHTIGWQAQLQED